MSFIPSKGNGKHRENLKRDEVTVLRPRDQVRDFVTRGEGISTPRARSTVRYPLLLSILWVCLIYTYLFIILLGECMQKK